MSKTGPPSIKGTEFGADKLEAILNKYKRTLSEQLLKIKEEVQVDEDYYCYNSPLYGRGRRARLARRRPPYHLLSRPLMWWLP
jgi:hypothetical protein